MMKLQLERGICVSIEFVHMICLLFGMGIRVSKRIGNRRVLLQCLSYGEIE